MNVSVILFYVMRAARFSLAVCAVYGAARLIFLRLKREKIDVKRECARLLTVAYLSALIEIIALRGGIGNTRQLNGIPLQTTFRTLKGGLWSFAYHFFGNICWFVPLGMLLHRKGMLRALGVGAAVSFSLEALQWLMKTGVSDVDDVIINALGALIGAVLMRALNKIRQMRRGNV